MKSNVQKVKFACKVAALVSAFALAGCAFIPTSVHPGYKVPAATQKIPSAENVDVHVVVQNEKKRPKIVQNIHNGYNMKTSVVYMNVGKIFKAALIQALQAKGFTTNNTGNTEVTVVIHHYWSHEVTGFEVFGKGIVQHGYTNETVTVSKNGKAVFQHTFTYHKVMNSGFFGLTGFQNTIQLHMLNGTINEIVNDPQFIDALMTGNSHGATAKHAAM